jgi:hypothetical protein
MMNGDLCLKIELKKKSSSRSSKSFEKSVRELRPDEYFWTVISHVTPAEVYQNSESFITILMISDSVFLVLIGIISWQHIIARGKK